MTASTPQLPNDKEPVGTPAWRRFFRALARRSPHSGTASFAAATSVAVALNPALSDDRYNVFLETPENRTFWITSKTKAGFTLNASTATSITIGYSIVRR